MLKIKVFGSNFGEIDRLREKNPDIKFRAGIELDNDPETSLDGHRWVEKNYDKLDFVLCSAHFVKGFAFDHPAYKAEYDKYDINDLYRSYYEEIRKIASNGLADAMAHLDLIKIFKFFPTENMNEVYHETLDLIKEKDLSMEISTAGFIKPIGIQYPDFDIIKLAQEKGITFTIASDAHAAQNLSHHYGKLEEILKELNINEVATYHRHERKMISPFAV